MTTIGDQDVDQSVTPQQEAKTQENETQGSDEYRDETTTKTQKKNPVQGARSTGEEQGWVSHWIGTTPVRHNSTPLQWPNQRP